MATSSAPAASFKTIAWSFSDPIEALSWLTHLGAVRAALLLTIEIHVKPFFQDWQIFDNFLDGTVWYMLLTALSKLCTGLVALTVHFYEPDREARLMGWKGYGRSLMFVRGLAMMRDLSSLKQLALGGFYAAPWPEYLGDTVGLPVIMRLSRGEEAALKRYQQGTDRLVPREKRDVEEGATGESQKVAFRRFQKMVGSACERLDFTRLTNMLQMPMEVIKEEKKKEADLNAFLEAAMKEAEGKEVEGESEDIGKEENKEAEPEQVKHDKVDGKGENVEKEENKEAEPEQAGHGEGKGEGDNVEKGENKDH